MESKNQKSTFKREMMSGVFYTALSKYSGIVVSLLVTAVLARALSPSDFGIVAIATVFIFFFSIFSDLGIGAAVVQNRTLDKKDLNHLYSFSVYLGFFLALVFWACSPLISAYYNDATLNPVCQILSLSILFNTVNLVPNALLLKNKRFKFIAVRTLFIQIALGALSVGLALVGVGVYALLVNPVLGALIQFVVNYRQYPQSFFFHVDKSSLMKIASFSVYQFLFSFVNYFTRNLDKLLIGRAIGLQTLGYYEKSYRLMLLPLQNITSVITPVMHPIFAEFQDELKMQRDKYLGVIRLLALIGFPLSVFLYFTASELILIMFGEQWKASIPIFKILSLTVWCQVIGSSQGTIFQATNQTKRLFITGSINAVVNVAGLLIGVYVYGTAEGVAWMMVITFYIGIWNFWYIFRYLFHSPIAHFVKAMLPGIYLMLVVGVLIGGLSYYMEEVSIWISLICKGAVYCLITLLALQLYSIVNVKRMLLWVVRKFSGRLYN